MLKTWSWKNNVFSRTCSKLEIFFKHSFKNVFHGLMIMSSLFLLICYNLKPQMYLRVVGFTSNSHLFKGLNYHRNHLSTYSIAQEFQVTVTVTDLRAASKSLGENENTWGKKTSEFTSICHNLWTCVFIMLRLLMSQCMLHLSQIKFLEVACSCNLSVVHYV